MSGDGTLRPLGESSWFQLIAMTLLTFFAVALGLHWLNTFLNVDRAMEVYDLNNKETARIASNLYFSKMTALAQVTIGLLTGGWALVTLSDVRIRVEGRSSAYCFVVANVSFAMSLSAYVFGYDFIVSRIFHHASFDIDAPFISSVSSSQQLTFLNGLLSLGCSVWFGRRSP